MWQFIFFLLAQLYETDVYVFDKKKQITKKIYREHINKTKIIEYKSEHFSYKFKKKILTLHIINYIITKTFGYIIKVQSGSSWEQCGSGEGEDLYALGNSEE